MTTISDSELITLMISEPDQLDLDYLTVITDRQAELLSRYDGGVINLGIENMTDRQAELLSKYTGGTLNLGIKSITDVQAKFLGNASCYNISLDGLMDISENQVAYLASFKGITTGLSLKGLTVLGEKQAHYFGKAQCECLDLSGIIKFTNDIEAISLSKYAGNILVLNGIEEITDNQVRALSNFKGKILWLKGLTSITDEQVEIFVNYQCGELYLTNVKNLTVEQQNYIQGKSNCYIHLWSPLTDLFGI